MSDGFWKRHFGGDPGILGKTITLRGAPHEVVGIVAPGAQTEAQVPPEIWIPLQIDPNSNNQVHYFLALARLRPGVTLGMARAQLQLAAKEYRRRFPNTVAMQPGYSFGADTVREAMVKDVRPSLLILLGVVSLVLLIACANVANLLLIRAAGRAREIAIRAAVGAGRSRLVRQLLTESVALSLAGGILGFLLGGFGIRSLLTLNPTIPRIGAYGYHVALDWRVLAFTVFVSLITGVLFGLVPALQSSGIDLNTGLRESGGRSGSSVRQNKIRSALVISEMSLALVLLIGAALLIRSFITLRSVNPGFDPRNILTLRMSLSSSRFGKTHEVNQFVHDGVQRLMALPEVVSAGVASWLPFESGATLPFVVVGRPLAGASHGFGHWRNISTSYFDVLKIPLVRGRLFTYRDDGKTAGVVIINQAMAREYWTNNDPLNDRIVIAPNVGPEFDEPPRQIVGIVGDVHEDGLDQNPRPTMYVPIAQVSDARNQRARQSIVWIIRTRVEPHSLAPAVESDLRKASGGLPVGELRSMNEIVALSTARQDFTMELLNIFGGVALLLAAIGIYGLISYSVQQRKQEIGIRMALGAGSRDVRNMVVFRGMRLAMIGVALGMCIALGLTRLIAGFLFGVQARDPAVFILTPILLTSVAFLAVWFPAHRASRLSPIEALRHE